MFHHKKKMQNTGQAGFLNSPGDFCWFDSKMGIYRHLLRLIYLLRGFTVGNLILLLVD